MLGFLEVKDAGSASNEESAAIKFVQHAINARRETGLALDMAQI
jgi:hypothetical protein